MTNDLSSKENPNNNAAPGFFAKAWNWYKEYRRKKKEQRKKPMTLKEQIISWAKTIVGAIIVVMIINGLAVASFVVPTGSMQKTVMAGDFLFVNKFIYGPSSPQVIPFLNIPLPFFRFPGIRDPKQGDVIVFIYPGERNEVKASHFDYFLKRCIAVAGDSLFIQNKHVYVNGVEMPLPPEGQFIYPVNNIPAFAPGCKGFTFDNFGPIRIPKKGDAVSIDMSNINSWTIFIEREGHKVSFGPDNSILIDGAQSNTYTVEKDYCFGMGDNRDDSKDSRDWGFIPYEAVVGTPIMVYWSWSPDIPLKNLGEKLKSIRWGRIGTFIH